jgi:hypothetical protein
MAQLLRVQTASGPILVEISPSDAGSRQVTSVDQIADAVETLGDGLGQLVAVANEFAAKVRNVGEKVKKAELEIGFEVTGEGKFFFASAGAKATFSAKLEFDLTK